MASVKETSKTVEYLYDCTGDKFRDLSYVGALQYKIVHAYTLMDKLREEAKMHLHEPAKYEKILKRYQDVNSAVIFNTNLLKELE